MTTTLYRDDDTDLLVEADIYEEDGGMVIEVVRTLAGEELELSERETDRLADKLWKEISPTIIL